MTVYAQLAQSQDWTNKARPMDCKAWIHALRPTYILLSSALPLYSSLSVSSYFISFLFSIHSVVLFFSTCYFSPFLGIH